MKKLILTILTASVLFTTTTFATAEVTDKITVKLDGAEVAFPDAQPYIDARERTLVPIRFVSEAMGAAVDWDEVTRTAIIAKNNDTIRYTIGEAIAYKNDEMLVFDSFGVIKDERTFVPLRFVSEMLDCTVEWQEETRTIDIKSPSQTVRFPEPVITVHYPDSAFDKRMLWITLDNYSDFKRECPYYEFKVEFITPGELNVFEQDEGAINGWQTYTRNEYRAITASENTIVSVSRPFYTTRANKSNYTPNSGDELQFKLTVLRKCSNESKEYIYSEQLQLPFPIETYTEG